MLPDGDRKGGRGRGGRYGKDVEPEWMSAPVDQDNLMELKGFDDSPEKEVKGNFLAPFNFMENTH